MVSTGLAFRRYLVWDLGEAFIVLWKGLNVGELLFFVFSW
jgi:hypothetical protein